MGGGKVAVVVGGGHLHRLILGETLGGFLHHGKSLRQNVIEHLLGLVVALFFQFVDAFVKVLLLIDGHVVFFFDTGAQLGELTLLGLHGFGYTFLEFSSFRSQGVVAQRLDGGINRQRGIQERLNNLEVALTLVSEQFG